MGRNIKTLRPPFVEQATDQDIQEAAVQYVRKVSGFRAPPAQYVAEFDAAVAAVADATRTLLAGLAAGPGDQPG